MRGYHGRFVFVLMGLVGQWAPEAMSSKQRLTNPGSKAPAPCKLLPARTPLQANGSIKIARIDWSRLRRIEVLPWLARGHVLSLGMAGRKLWADFRHGCTVQQTVFLLCDVEVVP